MRITGTAPVPELGSRKTLSQHLGNAGFGVSSVAAFGDSFETLMNASNALPGIEMVPGLNLGVAAVESYNSIRKLKEHDPVVAATSAGNATGTLGSFLGQVGVMTHQNLVVGLGASFGAVGGILGIGAGIAEVREGHSMVKQGGSHRVFTMGCLDIASGVVSLSGAGLVAAGAGHIGVALMMGSNLIDLAGIGVDYLWRKTAGPDREQQPAPATGTNSENTRSTVPEA